MNVIDLLKQQHQDLKGVMDKISVLEEENKDDCDKLFQEFKKTYNLHNEIEDEVIYPAFKEKKELEKDIRKSYQAHHVVNMGILELRLIPYGSDAWMPKFLVIRDSILTHMNEEENNIFTKASQLFQEDELNNLAEKIENQFLAKA